jgi:hypothetical protein
MINLSRAIRRPLPIRYVSHCTGRSLNPTARWITGKIIFFFQFRIQILTHESNFHVTGFSYESNISDVVERVSYNRTDLDVAAIATSWILANIPSR